MEDAGRTTDKIRAFWNARAALGDRSGSNDFILKDLETSALLERIEPQSRIIDVGCGNGKTLIALAKNKGCTGTGIDFSEDTIELALRYREEAGLGDEVQFRVAEVPGDPWEADGFDYAITQRCLVNLLSRGDQAKAFAQIVACVRPGGYFLMIEDSLQGLNSLNVLRGGVELSPIPPPWHNLFLDEEEVRAWKADNCTLLEGPIAVASTYYLLSRVIYAKVATDQGLKTEELRYDSEINVLAYRLPRNIGNWGAPKLWVWQRAAK